MSNIAQTLARLERRFDVTGRHFALALAFFVALAVLGVALAVDFVPPVELSRTPVVPAHATIAV